MKPPTLVPRFRDYLRILGRYWIVIVCTTVLSAGAGWLAHKTTDPQYQASTKIFVETVGGAEVFDAYHGNRTATERALSIRQLARNPQVAKRTIDQLGLDQTPSELIGRITPVVRSALIEIYVTGESPELARDTANSVTYNLLALTDELADLDKGSDTDVVLVDAASGVGDTRGPLKKYLLLGAALGLGLSLVLVIALGRVRDSVLDEEHLAHLIGEKLAERHT
jgi:capsular polysaccharide biosynthesis protein